MVTSHRFQPLPLLLILSLLFSSDSRPFGPGIPPSFAQVAGLYDSAVHLNFHGNDVLTFMRQYLQVPDNNMFTTAFVVEALLESALLQTSNFTVTPDVYHSLSAALKAMATYNNRNPGGSAAQKVFWAERLNNAGVWETYPPNLVSICSLVGPYHGGFIMMTSSL